MVGVSDREIRLAFQAWDLCSVGDRLFLSTDNWETPIVEIDASGAIVSRFGRAAWTTTVRHYTLSGAHRFDMTPPGMTPVEPQVTEQGTVRYGPAPGSATSDALIEVVHLGDGALVQVRRANWAAREQGILTFVIDLSSGAFKSHSDDVPRIHDVLNGRVVSSVTEPFPQLLFGTWEPGG